MSQTHTQSQSRGLSLRSDPRQLQFKNLLEGESFQSTLRAALPRTLRPERMVRVVLSAMQTNPDILECEPHTVLLSIMRAATMGLEPDGGVLGHGYLVPFWNSKNRRKECQFITGYRGLCKLARNSGEVVDVWAKVVHETDDFEFDEVENKPIRHKRNYSAEPGRIIGAYAAARFRDGYTRFEYMTAHEIEEIKAKTASKTREGKIVGPWTSHEGEMYKKTVVRRLAKYLPLAPETSGVFLDEYEQAVTPMPDTIFSQIPKVEPAGAMDLLNVPDSEIDGPHAEDASQVEPDEYPEAEYATKAHVSPPRGTAGKPRRKRETAPDGSELPDSLFENTPDATEQGQ